MSEGMGLRITNQNLYTPLGWGRVAISFTEEILFLNKRYPWDDVKLSD
jgi:hypothetical protein